MHVASCVAQPSTPRGVDPKCFDPQIQFKFPMNPMKKSLSFETKGGRGSDVFLAAHSDQVRVPS